MNYTQLLACALLLSPFAGSGQTLVKYDLYTGTKSEKARLYYNEGTTASDNKDYKGAIPKLRAAIAEDPGYIDAYDNLGVAYRRLNQLDSAEYYYKESVRRYPKGVVALRDLGVVAERRGKFEQAVEYYKQAVAIDQEDAENYFSLARGYSLLQKYNEALENGYKAEQLYKKENSQYIGDCYFLLAGLNAMVNNKEAGRKYAQLAKAAGRELPAPLADALK